MLFFSSLFFLLLHLYISGICGVFANKILPGFPLREHDEFQDGEDERGSVETVDVRNLDNPSILPRVFLFITAEVENKRRSSDGEHDRGCSGARHGIAIGICFHSYKAQGTASATFFSLWFFCPSIRRF
jgi:hypothetical protein